MSIGVPATRCQAAVVSASRGRLGSPIVRTMWRHRVWPVLSVTLVVLSAVAILILALRPEAGPGLLIERRLPAPGIDDLLVHVTGAVHTPGVVTLPAGARVADAIALAGGFSTEADQDAVNQARRVVDEETIRVPRSGESPALLDLNAASAEALEALPGIGPVYAQRILDARIQRLFVTSDDLVSRGLLPARTYAELRDLVTVR